MVCELVNEGDGWGEWTLEEAKRDALELTDRLIVKCATGV